MLKNSSKKDQDSIFYEGKNAFSNGIDISENPYLKIDSSLASVWESGWNKALESRRAFEISNKTKSNSKKRELKSISIRYIAYLLGILISLVGGLTIIFGIFLFGYQVYFWLRTATWANLPISYLFIKPSVIYSSPSPLDLAPAWFHNTWLWLESPSDWHGIHRVVKFFFDLIPLSLVWVVVGMFPFGWGLTLIVKNNEALKKHNEN